MDVIDWTLLGVGSYFLLVIAALWSYIKAKERAGHDKKQADKQGD